jgi:preprotein translocase subunit SecA
MLNFIQNVFGSPNERKIKKLGPLVDHICDMEGDIQKLSDDALRAKTDQFRNELANRAVGANPQQDRKYEQEALELILPEAFAVAREASKRILNMRHFDVQLIGGIVLHNGSIAEMRTGEGKTLVATLPAYLNGLTGKGVHVVTVNDYLASRDAEWMGRLYNFLGLSVGSVLSNQRGFNIFKEKKEAYAADITYGTNNEFGFDYLRDNMAGSLAQLCQRPFHYAIIDEVDSILIDEARTPLIISGRLEQSAETYHTMARIAPLLQPERDYTVEEKSRNVILTEDGIDRAQEVLNVEDLFDPRTNLAHHLLQALKAKELFKIDIDYVVKDDEVVIVDEFTGRLMDGRRWSDGLHQAVEAKENVKIQDETQTLASITFQNLFRLYPKLSGMTGTAMTEEAEFGKIYNLEVTSIPTNQKDTRVDKPDIIFKTERVKFLKVVEEVISCYETGRPVLVGTTSIEKSEWISTLLTSPEEMTKHLLEKAQRLLESLPEGESAERKQLDSYLNHPASYGREDFEKLAQEMEPKNKELADNLRAIAQTAGAVQAIRKGVAHKVLNAKQHEQEASIVTQAGRLKAVTIATNMAGRGTDILLGGNPEGLAKNELETQGLNWRLVPPEEYKALVKKYQTITEKEKEQVSALGGLHIVGTERHESRRIDNQLRGRAARQGDPGSTRFYLSLEDGLMRLFGGQRISGLMDMLKVDETLPISATLVSRAIEGAQRKVEAYHFDIRKNILQYDDVLTEQRKLIYGQRRKVLEGDNLRSSVVHMLALEMERCVSDFLTPEGTPGEWDPETIDEMLLGLHSKVPQLSWIEKTTIAGKSYGELITFFQEEGLKVYESLEAQLTQVAAELQHSHGIVLSGLENQPEDQASAVVKDGLTEAEKLERDHPMRLIERDILLSVVDSKWIDYLHNLDSLREGIGLRAYGQKDPLIEYKREAYEMFQQLTYDIQRETISLLFRARFEIQLERQYDEAHDENGDFIDTLLTDALETATPMHSELASLPESDPYP